MIWIQDHEVVGAKDKEEEGDQATYRVVEGGR